jgi:Tfp pilus assembly protein PilF
LIYSQQRRRDRAQKEYADAVREEPDSARAPSYFGQYPASVEKN